MKIQLVSLLILAVMVSCATPRNYQAPDVTNIAAPTWRTLDNNRFETAEPVSAWWRGFEDDDLSELVQAALTHNRSVAVAVANLNEARALAGATNRDRFPTAEVNGAATASRESNQGPFGPLADRNLETYSAGVDAFWELDLFGRIRNRIAAAEAQVQIAEADLRGLYVSVAAETARWYIELRGAQYRLAVAERNAANQKRTFELTQDLEEGGRGDRLNVVRARAQLELTQASIPVIESEVNAGFNRLIVLTGRALPDLRARLSQARALPSLPTAVAVGDPVGMLQRRPDVAAAERQLAAATARYNLNVADLYPKVNLLGGLGFLSTSFGKLGDSDSFTASIGPQIQWAGFNLGRVRDRIEAADARAQASLAAFEATVFRALEETDSAMVSFSKSEVGRRHLFNAAKAGEKAVELAQLRFDAGVDDFLDVLDAERTLLNAQEALARSETQSALELIAVYKSLGGGWQVGQSFNQSAAKPESATAPFPSIFKGAA